MAANAPPLRFSNLIRDMIVLATVWVSSWGLSPSITSDAGPAGADVPSDWADCSLPYLRTGLLFARGSCG